MQRLLPDTASRPCLQSALSGKAIFTVPARTSTRGISTSVQAQGKPNYKLDTPKRLWELGETWYCFACYIPAARQSMPGAFCHFVRAPDWDFSTVSACQRGSLTRKSLTALQIKPRQPVRVDKQEAASSHPAAVTLATAAAFDTLSPYFRYPGAQPPAYLDATLPGDRGFDPFRLGENPNFLPWLVEGAGPDKGR